MNLKNVFLIFSTISTTSFASSLASVSIYGTPLIYKNSQAKKDGYFLGSYIYYGYGLNHSFEGEFDYTKINLQNGATLNQIDISIAYTYYYGYSKLRVGGHFISNDEDKITPYRNTNNGIIAILGYSKFKPYQWEIGGETFFSYYPNYSYSGNSSLKVFQINGIFTYGKGNYYKEGRTYITLKPYLIYISNSPTSKDTYLSLEGSFNYYIKNWVFSGIGYIGKTVFPVKNGGFLVYNVAEERLYGLGGSIRYIINRNSSITLSIFSETFRDELSINKANLTTVMLGAGFSF